MGDCQLRKCQVCGYEPGGGDLRPPFSFDDGSAECSCPGYGADDESFLPEEHVKA